MTRKKSTALVAPEANSLTANKYWLQPGMTFDPSTRICNASSKQTFTGTTWNIRDGGLDNKKWKSKGEGC